MLSDIIIYRLLLMQSYNLHGKKIISKRMLTFCINNGSQFFMNTPPSSCQLFNITCVPNDFFLLTQITIIFCMMIAWRFNSKLLLMYLVIGQIIRTSYFIVHVSIDLWQVWERKNFMKTRWSSFSKLKTKFDSQCIKPIHTFRGVLSKTFIVISNRIGTQV